MILEKDLNQCPGMNLKQGFVLSQTAGPDATPHSFALRRQPATFLHHGGLGRGRIYPGAPGGV